MSHNTILDCGCVIRDSRNESESALLWRLMGAANEYAAANPDVTWALTRTKHGVCWTNLSTPQTFPLYAVGGEQNVTG